MKRAAPFLIVLAGILWGTMGLYVRVLNGAGMYAIQIVFLRAVITALVMAVVILLTGLMIGGLLVDQFGLFRSARRAVGWKEIAGVAVMVVKNARNKLLHAADVAAFNAQYGNTLSVKTSDKFHDRFLIIDKTVLIHVGASLNHLGKRCFAFSSLDKSNIPDIMAKI